MKKLHLGCGAIILPDYINIDIQFSDDIDYVGDIQNLPYKHNSIDEIYSCHVIEHFSKKQIDKVLYHWYDLLKPGGVLRVATPDFSAICNEYIDGGDIKPVLGLLSGGQRDRYDFHRIHFDFNYLKEKIENIGFVDVVQYDWKKEYVGVMNIDDYSQAYLPHMDKENGRLMSLNVQAIKRKENIK